MSKEQLAAEMANLKAALADGSSAKGIGAADLCAKYPAIKAILNKILPLLSLVPHGAEIRAAIEFLMSLADKACPTPAPSH